jgi:hypothetical protein
MGTEPDSEEERGDEKVEVGLEEERPPLPTVLDCGGNAVVMDDEIGGNWTSWTGMAVIPVTAHPAGASPSKATWRMEPKAQKMAWPLANASFAHTKVIIWSPPCVVASLRCKVLLSTRENSVEMVPTVWETSNFCDDADPFVDTY